MAKKKSLGKAPGKKVKVTKSAGKKAAPKTVAKKAAKKAAKAVKSKAKEVHKKKTVAKKPTKPTKLKATDNKKKAVGKKLSPKAEARKAETKPIPEKKSKKAEIHAKGRAIEASEEIVLDTDIEPVEIEREEEVILTDAEGRRYCRVNDCDQIGQVEGYCRFHYLLFWKKIQVRKRILSEGKLERYIEELTARYPDKYLEMLRKDLRTEKDFLAAIQELEIDDSSDETEFEDESQSYIEEMRGVSGESASRDDDDF